MKKTILSIALALFASTMLAPAAFADDLAGKTELNIFGGFNHFDNNGGNHGLYGVNVGRGVAKHVTLFGEFAHTPYEGVNLFDYMGGVKLNLGNSEKVTPYALAGIGAGTFDSDFGSNTNFALHLGGGVRFYVSDHWGVVPEVRWVRHFNDFNDTNTVRVTGGVFFQW
jgi:opacity protein-like surface antigen